MVVRLQSVPFGPGAELDAFTQAVGGGGAVATFTGRVRSAPEDPLEAMSLEHYPALAQAQLEALREQAISRFALIDAWIIHRFGRLLPGEPIVQVMAASLHRQAALDGAGFLMDTLKTNAPFWKKEHRPGKDNWVEARASDDAAAARWT